LIIQSDRDALRKILTQLLRNAATANPEGGEVGVTAWLESSDSEKDFILVQVSDKGGGIPSEDLPIVFNPHPETFKIEGLGDGGVDFVRLKTLIEVLGGRTWVDSEQGIGSVFSILLPAIHEPDQTNGSEGIY
jgi:signal transduction histidine kinase